MPQPGIFISIIYSPVSIVSSPFMNTILLQSLYLNDLIEWLHAELFEFKAIIIYSPGVNVDFSIINSVRDGVWLRPK